MCREAKYDTIGAMFLKGEKIAGFRRVLDDYARFPEIYGPEIVETKLTSTDGPGPEVFTRVRKHFVITVVLDMLSRVHFAMADAANGVEHTTAIRIREAKDPEHPDAGERSPEEERGFPWRYESYWRLEETEEGLLVEHQMISLSRRAPASLQFMLRPILNKLPTESMYKSVVATRQALLKTRPEEAGMISRTSRATLASLDQP